MQIPSRAVIRSLIMMLLMLATWDAFGSPPRGGSTVSKRTAGQATRGTRDAQAVPNTRRVLESGMHHLRAGSEREWAEFPEKAERTSLLVQFRAARNKGEQTLRLRQQDVKQTWNVLLNGKRIGRLHRDENDMVVYWPIPVGGLRDGDNRLSIEPGGNRQDDIRVGEISLDNRPMNETLSEATIEVHVSDRETNAPIPCRITVLNQHGALATVGAQSDNTLAVRPGVIYSGTGKARFGVPATGEYTIYAGRGFEYGIDSKKITPQAGKVQHVRLSIRREVPTGGYVSCDTHVHTLTHSGHGDASVNERMLTLAGEGIELPIATDHNVHIDHNSFAVQMGVRRYFTPVIGNEVTTRSGHFNVFPVETGARIPNYRLNDWKPIFQSIYATPGVKAVILNHARDLHGSFRPFGPKHHIGLIGKNLDGWKLRANAMEVINSGAQQTDVLQLYRDWFGMLNRGFFLTPVGCSDSHDVARHFVGQARTYIRCTDTDAGNIDVAQAVESFVNGRVMVSLGLLAEVTVDDKYGPGELVPVSGEVKVAVRVLGPSWTTAETVALYANGQKIREARIRDGKQPGVKWKGVWTLPRPKHDTHLAVIARGPGVRELYWPIAKPYQPDSIHWNPQVVGSSGAVWLDADRDGKRTSAYQYAQRVVEQAQHQLPRVIKALTDYDEAVASQAAELLASKGVSLIDRAARDQLKSAPAAVQRGFEAFLDAQRQSDVARREK